MEVTEKVRNWKALSKQIKQIADPMLRKAMFGEYRKRAIDEWGFDPINGNAPTPKIVLDDWEKKFVNDIRNTRSFQIDTREVARAQTLKETRFAMWEFVKNGGMLHDIPDGIRTPMIRDLYFETLHKLIEETIRQADEVYQRDTARVND